MKIFGITIFVLFSINSIAQNIDFKDIIFKNKLVYLGFDLNSDNEISFSEAEKIQTLVIPLPYLEEEITDLSGIEYFVNLDTFSCAFQKLKNVNLNKNLGLKFLDLSGNYNLDTIQFDSLSNLSYLNITNIGYKIDTLNLTHLPHLKELHIDYKSKLNISNNPELEILDAIHIPDINVSQNLMLQKLTCSNLTSIDLSQNHLLESFSCIAFGTDSTDGLKILDLSNNLLLKELDCSQNYLTHLDLTNNSKLEKLICENNPLKKLDLSKNTKLKMLSVSLCELDSLNISTNTELTYLHCHYNQIKKLNLENNRNLEFLYCSYNQIDSLDLINCQSLIKIDCSTNNLRFLDLSRNNQLEWIQMVENPELKNVCVWEIPFPPTSVWLNDWGCPNLNYVDCNTSVTQHDKVNIRIYPNPSNGEINIEFPQLQKINSIILTNLNGQVILKKMNFSENYQYKLDIGKFANGMYELIIETDTEMYNKKIMKKSGI